MTERTTASSSSAWDADVLPTEEDDGSDPIDADDGDREIEVLVAEIEQTRSEMTGTVEELGDRLDPGTIAERTTEKVREATIGKVESKVEDVTNAASTLAANAGDTVQQTGSGVIETIKRNPVPAALAGFGIGWLVLNRQSGKSSNSDWARSGAPVWADQTASQRGFSDSSNLGGGTNASDKIDEVTGKAKQTAQDVASTVGETASDAATTVKSGATSMATTAQNALESNPLAIGAIALAVGTAVGLALPASQAEKRVMGQAGSQLIDKAENAVTKPLEEMQRTTER